MQTAPAFTSQDQIEAEAREFYKLVRDQMIEAGIPSEQAQKFAENARVERIEAGLKDLVARADAVAQKGLEATAALSPEGEVTSDMERVVAFLSREDVKERLATKNEFIRDMCIKVAAGRALSDNMVNAVMKFVVKQDEFDQRDAERAEQDKDAMDVPTGPNTVEGVVVSAKWRVNQYGEQLKIVVRDDRGFRVWGTAPQKLQDAAERAAHNRLNQYVPAEDALRGAKVRFDVADISPSDDDLKFGFFKRPTNPTLVELGND